MVIRSCLDQSRMPIRLGLVGFWAWAISGHSAGHRDELSSPHGCLPNRATSASFFFKPGLELKNVASPGNIDRRYHGLQLLPRIRVQSLVSALGPARGRSKPFRNSTLKRYDKALMRGAPHEAVLKGRRRGARMTSPTPQQLAQSGTLEELYTRLLPIRMGAGWAKPTPSLWPEPKQNFQPFVWSYAQAKGALDAAGRLINTELAERRNLILQKPAEGYATSRTIVAAYQMIMPGEKARSHRHTPNALRLIVDAEPGAYTIVNGDRKS